MVNMAGPKSYKRYGRVKSHIRKAIIEKRKKLSEEYRHEYAMELSKKFFDTELYKNSKRILSYVSIHGEFETKYINRRILAEGKTLLLPKTYEMGVMKVFVVEDLKSLEKNSFGLHEPLETKEQTPDLIIVPAVAFDLKGNRLGFGGGFYDRYLEGKKISTIGLCYGFQIVENLPKEEHDIPVDRLLFL